MSSTTATSTVAVPPDALVRLADWSYRRRRRVLLLWIVVLLGHRGRCPGVRRRLPLHVHARPAPTRRRRRTCSRAASPPAPATTSTSCSRPRQGKTVDDPAVQAEIGDILDQFGKQPHVSAVVSPFSPEGARQIAPRRTIAYGTLHLDQTVSDYKKADAKALLALGKKVDRPDLQVELAGFVLGGAEQTQLQLRGHRPARGGADPARSASARCWPWACRSSSRSSGSGSA